MACRFKAACSPRRFPNALAAKCASRSAWQDCVAGTIDRAAARANRARMRQVEGAGGRRAGANGILTPRTRRGGRARFKAHAWRACKLGRVSGVQIPPSPPSSLACFPTFWGSDEMGAWGAIHTQPWTRRMPMTAAERKSRAKFSVGDLVGPSCEPNRHVARTMYSRRTPRGYFRPRESIGCPELAPARSRAGVVRFVGSLRWWKGPQAGSLRRLPRRSWAPGTPAASRAARDGQ